jgi:hypothetical protein
MTDHRTLDDFYANLQEQLSRTLREVPFRYYTTDDGAVECGHLLHPGDYQRLILWLEWLRSGLDESNLTKRAKPSLRLIHSVTE